MSRLHRDSIPLWLISPDPKSQLGAGKGRVVNPERSPLAPTLILLWSYFLSPLWLETKPNLSFLCLCFGSCCSSLPAEKTLFTANPDTHTLRRWQESVYAFAMCPSGGRDTCPWSQPARHGAAARFTILFVPVVKSRGPGAGVGSLLKMLLFYINTEHQLPIRCRQMKAIS